MLSRPFRKGRGRSRGRSEGWTSAREQPLFTRDAAARPVPFLGMVGIDSTSSSQGHICPTEDRWAPLGLRLAAPWVLQCSHSSLGFPIMIHGALLCHMETYAHKTGERAKKAVLGHPDPNFFPNSHSFFVFSPNFCNFSALQGNRCDFSHRT